MMKITIPEWVYPTADFKFGCLVISMLIGFVIGLCAVIMLFVKFPALAIICAALVLAYGIIVPARKGSRITRHY